MDDVEYFWEKYKASGDLTHLRQLIFLLNALLVYEEVKGL